LAYELARCSPACTPPRDGGIVDLAGLVTGHLRVAAKTSPAMQTGKDLRTRREHAHNLDGVDVKAQVRVTGVGVRHFPAQEPEAVAPPGNGGEDDKSGVG